MIAKVHSSYKPTISQEMKDFILANFEGCYTNHYLPDNIEFAKQFDKRMLSVIHEDWQSKIDENPEFNVYYFDEPFSTSSDCEENKLGKVSKWISSNVAGLANKYGKAVIVGDLTKEAINKIAMYGCRVTYTAYRKLLFSFTVKSEWLWKILNKITDLSYNADGKIRIYWIFNFWYWLATPILMLKYLKKKYPEQFDTCWLHITMNIKYAKKLKKWCAENGIEIILYAGENTWETEEELKIYLQKWIEA